MNIIEKEIAKRQEIIDSKAEKLAKAEELKKEAEALELEALAIETEVLEAEIEELKGFLPEVETTEEVGTVEKAPKMEGRSMIMIVVPKN